ncbi:MAG: hypothetical protein TE42_06765 [Candidatus Synechococcus spongiarum SP3]|uniref:Uncharacterized protein n=1 Tax=Candidatus Synechococcus spongiarum SP3 TaxID=1604020 RepID=A0A0G2J4M1_9SYNE|nr:MAG: hypothetical protein TE42_06765 [Candidatus Synechococcus spongiarum SP3]
MQTADPCVSSGMPSTRMLLLATASRLRSRIRSGLADATAQVVTEAELAAQQLQQDWKLFWQEVYREAERLERPGGEAPAPDPSPSAPSRQASATDEQQVSEGGGHHQPEPATRKRASPAQVQETIDQLRAAVAELNQRLEQNTL